VTADEKNGKEPQLQNLPADSKTKQFYVGLCYTEHAIL